MSGHLGDLTEEQQQKFDEFRASELALHQETMDYLTELDRSRSLKLHNREATEDELSALREEREADWPYELLRFLRAQKWDVAGATEKYRTYLAWRREHNVDSILDQLPFNTQLLARLVGTNARGVDKEGRPIYIEKAGSIHVDAMLSCFTDEDILLGHVWQQENSVRRAAESSKKLGKHVETFAQIVDLNGLGMHAQRASKFTQLIITNDAAFYPERLGHLFVVNPPWVFPVLWNLIKGWIDPVTRNKIHVIKGDPRESEELKKYFDADQLPAEYGGTCDQCPDAPDCVKQYPLEEVLAILPIKEEDVAEQLITQTVKAGKHFEVKIPLSKGECGVWFWTQADKAEIEFEVKFVPKEEGAKEKVISAQARIVSSGIVPAQGSYRAPEDGELVLKWDNHFSYFSAKEFRFMTRVQQDRPEAKAPTKEGEGEAAAASSSSSSSA